MKKIVSAFFLFTALMSSYVFAADGCTNPKTAYDQTYCTAKLLLASDDELNQTYHALMHFVANDVKSQLVETERNWIHFRNQSCSADGTVEVDCNFKVNTLRINYLQDRLRECKVGHCQNEMILDRNFTA